MYVMDVLWGSCNLKSSDGKNNFPEELEEKLLPLGWKPAFPEKRFYEDFSDQGRIVYFITQKEKSGVGYLSMIYHGAPHAELLIHLLAAAPEKELVQSIREDARKSLAALVQDYNIKDGSSEKIMSPDIAFSDKRLK